MYAIGLLMALHFGGLDLGALVTGAPALAAALAVIVLSTVTTTFMDTYSAGVSVRHVVPIASPRVLALVMTAIGTVSRWSPRSRPTKASSIPSAHRSRRGTPLFWRLFCARRACRPPGGSPAAPGVWAIGVASYYGFLALDTPIGATLPSFAVTALLYVLSRRVQAIAHAA